jgi:hypothetical protein
MIELQLMAEGEVETAIEQPLMHEIRQLFVSLQHVFRQSELTLFIVEGGVVARRLADQECRVIVEKELVKMVGADHHQDVRLGARQRFAIRLHLALPLHRLRHLLLRRRGRRFQVKRMMCRGKDCR